MLINSWEKNTCEMNFRRVEIVSHCPNNRPTIYKFLISQFLVDETLDQISFRENAFAL